MLRQICRHIDLAPAWRIDPDPPCVEMKLAADPAGQERLGTSIFGVAALAKGLSITKASVLEYSLGLSRLRTAKDMPVSDCSTLCFNVSINRLESF